MRSVILIVGVMLCQTSMGRSIFSADAVQQKQPYSKYIKLGKDGRFMKRHYPETYKGIREFALRTAPSAPDKQQAEFNKQSMAFRAIEKVWNDAEPGSKERQAIQTGLLRWNWLTGDPILDNPRPVDYYMVYMECIFK